MILIDAVGHSSPRKPHSDNHCVLAVWCNLSVETLKSVSKLLKISDGKVRNEMLHNDGKISVHKVLRSLLC